MTASRVIEISDVIKIYQLDGLEVRALNGVTFSVTRGEFVAIMGPSGSGKTTMMNILGCLDRPTRGSYRLDGVDVSTLSDIALAQIRNQKIGFVFQSFNLLARTPAIENVEVPLIYAHTPNRRELATHALDQVGLANRAFHLPNQLSGGQQQRVAIARALVTHPALILADEPTGNIDTQTSEEIMALLQTLNDAGITILLVTHERDIADHAARTIHFRDGVIVDDAPVKTRRLARGVLSP